MVKIFKLFDADPDQGSGIFTTLDPGSGIKIFCSGIWDQHPGSVTLYYRHVDMIFRKK
jgi:hypothetical protein